MGKSQKFEVDHSPSLEFDCKTIDPGFQTNYMSENEPSFYPNLNYQQPSWSNSNPTLTQLEVLKGGIKLEVVELSLLKPFLVVGRLPICDIILEHQSISRYHAIFQFDGKGNTFLYDLNSTHHTFLNKTLVQPNSYQLVKDGDMIKFGQSSRVYLVQQNLAKLSYDQVNPIGNPIGNPKELEGVCWGFQEDAYDLDQLDLEPKLNPMDPFDESEVPTRYYYTDPKKALANFLDNRGYHLNFETSEEGRSHEKVYTVRVELPQEFWTDPFEKRWGLASGSKKKDTERRAALDACIQLDRLGVLTTNPTNTFNSKGRKLETYSSDEDDFYDRTKPNKDRKGKQPKVEVLTYSNLLEKQTHLQQQIGLLEVQLEPKLGTELEPTDALEGDIDAIDKVVLHLTSQQLHLDQQQVAAQMHQHQLELKKVEQLLHLTKPHPSVLSSLTKLEPKLPQLKHPQPLPNHPSFKVQAPSQLPNLSFEAIQEKEGNIQRVEQNWKLLQASKLVEMETELEQDQELEPELEKDKKAEKKPEKNNLQRNTEQLAEEEVEWVPPKGQNGDGKTSLNAKFGY